MKPFRLLPHNLFAIAAALALPLAAGAQTTTLPDETTPGATPRYTPVPRATPAPTPDVPVGTVNGQPVYRPLLASEVSSPVDRALVVYDFNRSQPKLSSGDLDDAVQDYKRAKFSNSDAKLDARLRTLNATRADFRQYVAEEVKIHIMLNSVSHNAVSIHAAQRAQSSYLARLHQTAAINTPRS